MDPTPPEEHGGLDAPVEQPWEVLQRADLVGSQSIPSPLAPGPQGKGSAATVTGAPADAGNPHEELEPVEARGKDSAALARPPAAAPSAAAAPVAGPPPAEEDLAARIAQLQAELQASQCDLRLEKEKNLTLRRAAIVACSFCAVTVLKALLGALRAHDPGPSKHANPAASRPRCRLVPHSLAANRLVLQPNLIDGAGKSGKIFWLCQADTNAVAAEDFWEFHSTCGDMVVVSTLDDD